MGCKTYDFNGDYSLRCCEQACNTPETKHVGHEHHLLQLHELSVSDEKKNCTKKDWRDVRMGHQIKSYFKKKNAK